MNSHDVNINCIFIAKELSKPLNIIILKNNIKKFIKETENINTHELFEKLSNNICDGILTDKIKFMNNNLHDFMIKNVKKPYCFYYKMIIYEITAELYEQINCQVISDTIREKIFK